MDTTEQLHFHFSLSCIGEGNGNPLQCSCLENPRDRGAWWVAVCGVAYWSAILEWVAMPSSGDLPNPAIEPRVPALEVGSLLSEPPGKP